MAGAAPINHDTTSSIAQSGKSAVGGAILGFVLTGLFWAAAAVVGVGAVAAVAGGVASLTGATTGIAALTFGSAAKAMLTSGLGLTATIGSGIVGGVITGTLPALIGGGLGLFSGASRVSAEKGAYARKLEAHSHTRENKMLKQVNDAQIAGMQQGYMAGMQEGAQMAQQQIVGQLQEEMLRQQMAGAPAAKLGGATAGAPAAAMLAAAGAETAAKVSADCETKCNTHVDALMKKREVAAVAAAAGTPQVG